MSIITTTCTTTTSSPIKISTPLLTQPSSSLHHYFHHTHTHTTYLIPNVFLHIFSSFKFSFNFICFFFSLTLRSVSLFFMVWKPMFRIMGCDFYFVSFEKRLENDRGTRYISMLKLTFYRTLYTCYRIESVREKRLISRSEGYQILLYFELEILSFREHFGDSYNHESIFPTTKSLSCRGKALQQSRDL